MYILSKDILTVWDHIVGRVVTSVDLHPGDVDVARM